MLDSGHIVIGTPDDAVEVLDQLREKLGLFRRLPPLHMTGPTGEATKKDYELYIRFVAPRFDNSERPPKRELRRLEGARPRIQREEPRRGQGDVRKYTASRRTSRAPPSRPE